MTNRSNRMSNEASKGSSMSAPAQRLMETVKASGLSKSEFARRIGVSPGAIENISSGLTSRITGTLARSIELEFGVSHRWIMNGADSQHENTAAGEALSARLMRDLREHLEKAADAAKRLESLYEKGKE